MSTYSLQVDRSNGDATASGLDMDLNGGQLVAEKATFRMGAGVAPLVMQLKNMRLERPGAFAVTADEANYYTELQIFTASQFSVKPTSILKDDPQSHHFHCSGGTLYDNGEPVPGNRICINWSGGGSSTITCTEGGNQVRWTENFTEQCPIE